MRGVLLVAMLLGGCSTTEYITPWFRQVRTPIMSWDKEMKETVVWERKTGATWKPMFRDKAAPVPLAAKRSLVIRSQKYVEIITEDREAALQLACSRDAMVSRDRKRIACIEGDTIRAYAESGELIGAYTLPQLIDGGQTAYSTHLLGFAKDSAELLAVLSYVPTGKQSPTCELYALRGASEITLTKSAAGAGCGGADASFWEKIPGMATIERGSPL